MTNPTPPFSPELYRASGPPLTRNQRLQLLICVYILLAYHTAAYLPKPTGTYGSMRGIHTTLRVPPCLQIHQTDSTANYREPHRLHGYSLIPRRRHACFYTPRVTRLPRLVIVGHSHGHNISLETTDHTHSLAIQRRYFTL